MTTDSTAASAKPRQGISTTAKIFWLLLVLLFLVVAGFVFSAWRELNRIDPVAAPVTGPANVEVLTPAGAGQNPPVFVPNNTGQTDIPTPTTTTAKPALTAPATPQTPAPAVATTKPAATPILPVNPPPAAKPAIIPATEKPEPTPKNTLDNLF